MAISRNARSLPDFPEFAQQLGYGVPGTPESFFSERLFRCSGRLFSKIHRKSLDLSNLRPVNRMASLPP
jgi:hypothetical protein